MDLEKEEKDQFLNYCFLLKKPVVRLRVLDYLYIYNNQENEDPDLMRDLWATVKEDRLCGRLRRSPGDDAVIPDTYNLNNTREIDIYKTVASDIIVDYLDAGSIVRWKRYLGRPEPFNCIKYLRERLYFCLLVSFMIVSRLNDEKYYVFEHDTPHTKDELMIFLEKHLPILYLEEQKEPLSLQRLCRINLRQYYDDEDLDEEMKKHNVPDPVRDFLSFRTGKKEDK